MFSAIATCVLLVLLVYKYWKIIAVLTCHNPLRERKVEIDKGSQNAVRHKMSLKKYVISEFKTLFQNLRNYNISGVICNMIAEITASKRVADFE